jgi:hypothetical protein
MGIEKTVPSVPHKDVDRRIQALRREQVRNTGLRFRFQMILQRYGTYQTYWQRICRQIEEGTYKRHVQKARAKIQAQEASAKRHDSGGYDIDVDFEMEMLALSEAPEEMPASQAPAPVAAPAPAPMPVIPRAAPVVPVGARQTWRKVDPAGPRAPAPAAVAAPAAGPAAVAVAAPTAAAAAPKPAPPRPTAAASPPVASSPKPVAPPAKPGDLTDARKRELYSRYVEAKRARGESTVGITYESMSRTLKESSDKLREKHGKTVDFEVTVKDGKTILKPILK